MIRAGGKQVYNISGAGKSTQPSLKRKVSDDQQYLSLEDNIKRFRITHTPGEIRLGKDLKELKDCAAVSIQPTDDPACVSVCFVISKLNEVSIPSQFLVKVPRYYPHHSPSVYCAQKEFEGPIIHPDSHEIVHSHLQNGWSAIGTLNTVLCILEDVRMQFAHKEFKVERAVTGSPAACYALHRYKENNSVHVVPVVIDADIDSDHTMSEN